MSASRTPDPNEVWRRYDAMEARLTAPLSQRMLDLAGLRPGMRVLDLATGRGEPAIAAAKRVAPGGHVLGVDVSSSMLDMARTRALEEGVAGLELKVMDAASVDGFGAGAFDAVLCRWGLMYMDAPLVALCAAHRALVPGGVMVLAVWDAPERVAYVTLPRQVLSTLAPVPPIDFDVSGTFRYADAERLRRDLQQSGFHVQHEEAFATPVMEAANAAELIAWVRAFGMGRLVSGLPEQTQRAWEAALVREAEGYREGGVYRLGGVTRIVVARRAASAT